MKYRYAITTREGELEWVHSSQTLIGAIIYALKHSGQIKKIEKL